ncbi:hypothetical protein T01_13489 [Trichinella spiralis]|uniref:Uncharacterized protein n=1 Tax=Trichinella spiralis TaxID=6334 RepID=A0A0V1BTQ6_TRISP|nr:hypothetical protein T01_13489 [Trichinella spiralis]
MIHSRLQSESTGLTPHKHTPNPTYVSCLMDSVHYELTAGYTGPAIDTPGAFLTDQLTQSLRGSSEFPLIAQDPFFHYFHLRQL